MNIRNLAVLGVVLAIAAFAFNVDPATAAAIMPGLDPASLGTSIAVMGMAGNYVYSGERLTLTAPYTVVSGAGAMVGGIFGVAVADVTSGAEGEFAIGGVWDLSAITLETFALGDPVYWDAGVKKCSNGSTGNKLIGVATATKSSSAVVVRVRLDGVYTA